MNLSRLYEYEVKEDEYCYLLEDTLCYAKEFKLNITALMPMIPRGKPKQIQKTFNKEIFCNNEETKPIVNENITTQNYLTIPRHPGSRFFKKHDGNLYLKENWKFRVYITPDNFLKIYMTDRFWD